MVIKSVGFGGLRRTSYEINPDTGLFNAEYVNIFGVPFTFLPHESKDGPPPPPPAPKTKIEPVGDMRTWYTGKPCELTKRSHINFCVFDSTWEASEAFELDLRARSGNTDLILLFV